MARKFGEGHVAAMARLGLKELRNALNPSRESVADNEIGLYGTLTQGEIADARDGPGKGKEQESREAKQDSRFATVSLDDIRAYAKELAEAQDRSREQAKENGKEQSQDLDRGDDMER
jgi:hypothetical protein